MKGRKTNPPASEGRLPVSKRVKFVGLLGFIGFVELKKLITPFLKAKSRNTRNVLKANAVKCEGTK